MSVELPGGFPSLSWEGAHVGPLRLSSKVTDDLAKLACYFLGMGAD